MFLNSLWMTRRWGCSWPAWLSRNIWWNVIEHRDFEAAPDMICKKLLQAQKSNTIKTEIICRNNTFKMLCCEICFLKNQNICVILCQCRNHFLGCPFYELLYCNPANDQSFMMYTCVWRWVAFKLKWLNCATVKFWLKSDWNRLLIDFFDAKIFFRFYFVATSLIKICPNYIKPFEIDQKLVQFNQK